MDSVDKEELNSRETKDSVLILDNLKYCKKQIFWASVVFQLCTLKKICQLLLQI